jgi:hypothetical protein
MDEHEEVTPEADSHDHHEAFHGGHFNHGHHHHHADAERPVNDLAVVSLITAVVCWPVGVITGLVARREIRRRGERGNGLALAGILVGAFMGAFWSFLALALFIGSINGGPIGGRCSGYSYGNNREMSCVVGRPVPIVTRINPGGPMIPASPGLTSPSYENGGGYTTSTTLSTGLTPPPGTSVSPSPAE